MPDSHADAAAEAQIADLAELATVTAREASELTTGVRELAAAASAEVAIPLLLLMLSSLQASGARLGAIEDVVPPERFEPDSGPDADLDPLRQSLANLLEGVDDYTDVIDPVTSAEVEARRMSDDLTDIVAALEHGLAHYTRGRLLEALWWWQFSYLSDWGGRTSSVLRVLQALLAHVRLDVDDDTASEAEFDALHP